MATPKKKATRKKAAKKKTPAARKAPTKRAAKTKAPPPEVPSPAKPRDPRLPPAGTVIEKTYKGRSLQVEVLEVGFRFERKEWLSLTAIAMAVTGAKSINGPLFFGIAKRTPKASDEGRSS